jgi:hypothetical protein
LLYDSVSSEKVSFSAREVISVFDWASVIVAVGEYEAERARGDPGWDGRWDAGRELREPREPREREPPDGWRDPDFSSKYSSTFFFFFFPLRAKEGKQSGGGGGGGGGGDIGGRDGESGGEGDGSKKRM